MKISKKYSFSRNNRKANLQNTNLEMRISKEKKPKILKIISTNMKNWHHFFNPALSKVDSYIETNNHALDMKSNEIWKTDFRNKWSEELKVTKPATTLFTAACSKIINKFHMILCSWDDPNLLKPITKTGSKLNYHKNVTYLFLDSP